MTKPRPITLKDKKTHKIVFQQYEDGSLLYDDEVLEEC